MDDDERVKETSGAGQGKEAQRWVSIEHSFWPATLFWMLFV